MDKRSLSVAILGSRGIPNRYGGFEAFATEISTRLVERGHRVTVYTVAEHPLKDRNWNGVERVLVSNPEASLGTFGQFIYDLRCNLHSRRQKFDIILHLGYTSDSVWYWLWAKDTVHIVNMDGQEWKRSKYSRPVRAFLRLAERMASFRSRWLVADHPEIEKYLAGKYQVPVRYIAYGAKIPDLYSPEKLAEWGLAQGNYDLIVARMEPENHIEQAIRAKLASGSQVPLVIVGNSNQFKSILLKKYKEHKNIRFIEAVYDEEKLNNLRHYSRIYVHGHSVGGTNPSLLEAMACSCRIVAHDNPFNRFVLGDGAQYFSSQNELASLFNNFNAGTFEKLTGQNLIKIKQEYNWEKITDAYEQLFYDATASK
jgi:glycosyltransferase involved in cell wall biosynthesis